MHSTYFHIRTVISVLKVKTLYQVLFGKKPENSEIKIFGCRGFLNIHRAQRRSKMADHSVPGLFTGAHNGMFRINLLKEGQLMKTRNVTFDETFLSIEQVMEDDDTVIENPANEMA